MIALAYEVPSQDDPEENDIAALLLRETGSGIERNEVLLTVAPFVDRSPAIAFDGTAFVYGWVHDKGKRPDPHSPDPLPGNEVVAVRVSTDGELLDASPVLVASPSGSVVALAAARGANGVAFAWQTAEKIQVALLNGPVRDLGGASMTLGALSPHDGGLLLVRDHARRTPELTEFEYLHLGADLSPIASGTLPPYEADAYWDLFDIDVIGNGDPVFAYAKSANEGRYGHVSRLFLRRTGEAPPRRRAVR